MFVHLPDIIAPRAQAAGSASSVSKTPSTGRIEGPAVQPDVETPLNPELFDLISSSNSIEGHPSPQQLASWAPWKTHAGYTASLLVFAVAIWVTLECLQQTSDGQQGILTITISESTATNVATVLPAVFMFSLKTMVEDCCFNVNLLYPFQKLAGKPSPIHPFLTESYVGRLPIVNWVCSIFNRQYLLTLTASVSLATAFLVTITSGLYTTVQSVSSIRWQAQASDSFDIHYVDLGSLFHLSRGSERSLFSITDGYNASAPPLLYDELVYYNLSFPDALPTAQGDDLEAQQTRLYQLDSIPAVRASLDCTFSSPGPEAFTVEQREDSANMTFVDELEIPTSCRFSPDELRNQTLTTFNTTIVMVNTNVGYFSAVQYLFWHPLTGTYTLEQPCWTIGFVFGYLNVTRVENVTVMHCFQRIEEVQTETTFIVPSMSVSTTPVESQPKILNATVKTLNDSALLPTAFGLSKLSHVTIDEEFLSFDPFYAHVCQGLDGFLPSGVSGWANRHKLFEATQRVYRRFMAILIHVQMRVPVPAPTADLNPQTSTTYTGQGHQCAHAPPGPACWSQNRTPGAPRSDSAGRRSRLFQDEDARDPVPEPFDHCGIHESFCGESFRLQRYFP